MEKVKRLIVFLFLILFIWLVFKGQATKGYGGLAMILIGLGGILSELYLYNKKYK